MMGADLLAFALALAYNGGILAVLLAIVEGIATSRLTPWTFRLGYPFVRQSVPASPPPSSHLPEDPRDTGNIRVRWLGPSECIFRRRFKWSDRELDTPFRLKYTLRWDGTQATLTGRLPVGATAFAAVWILGFGVSGFALIVSGGIEGLRFVSLLLGFVCLMCGLGVALSFIALRLERRRAQALIADLPYLFTTKAA